MTQHRYVALGDSFTEGVGDWDESRPNGVRGWADRVAEELLSLGDWSYANLAIRGRKAPQIIAEQVPAALELRPTLVTCYAGGNDILRPSVDVDDVVARLIDGILPLQAQGAEVLLFTAFDSGTSSKTFAATRSRYALYNELLRDAAEEQGLTLVDYWRMKEFQDWRYWDEDRLHMSSYGHQKMALNVLELLGRSSSAELADLPEAEVKTRLKVMEENLRWTRRHFVPWVARRLRGVSSGDGLTPKYPQLVTDLT